MVSATIEGKTGVVCFLVLFGGGSLGYVCYVHALRFVGGDRRSYFDTDADNGT